MTTNIHNASTPRISSTNTPPLVARTAGDITPTAKPRTYYDLGARMRRPKRPGLSAALSVALNVPIERTSALASNCRAVHEMLDSISSEVQRHARPVWERLVAAGVVPADWGATGARRFIYQGIELDHPAKVHHAIAIASDVPGEMEAEKLLHLWEGCAGVWGCRTMRQSNTVLWFVERRWATDQPTNDDGQAGAALLRAIEQHNMGKRFEARAQEVQEQVFIGAGMAPDAVGFGIKCGFKRAVRDALLAEMWEHAARSGWLVKSGEATSNRARFEGHPFRDLPNPFALALAVWELGYELRRSPRVPALLVAPTL